MIIFKDYSTFHSIHGTRSVSFSSLGRKNAHMSLQKYLKITRMLIPDIINHCYCACSDFVDIDGVIYENIEHTVVEYPF